MKMSYVYIIAEVYFRTLIRIVVGLCIRNKTEKNDVAMLQIKFKDTFVLLELYNQVPASELQVSAQ